MKIQDVEQITGMDRATIRYYEREGLLSPQREENGYRNYSHDNVAELERINLLRQLGMPIERIAGLQQGSEDFSAALKLQISALDEKIKKQARAQQVCQVIYDDCVEYDTLDARHYIQLLNEECKEKIQQKKTEFCEEVILETHPWRRYFARHLDYLWFTVLLDILLIVVLRLRPVPTGIINTIVVIATGFLFVPVEAILLHTWGTTPGKFVFGIAVETIDGVRPTFAEALHRSWNVLRSGRAFGIPLLELYFNLKNYRILTGKASNWHGSIRSAEWDEDFEIQYKRPLKTAGIALVAVCLCLTIWTAVDGIKPAHRGDSLSVPEFAKNYNATMHLLDNSASKMQPDGSFITHSAGYTIYIGGTPENEKFSYEYVLNDDIIDKIVYKNKWTEVFLLQFPDDRPFNAALTILLSQKGMGWKDVGEFENLWFSHNFTEDGSFSYGNIYCSWTVELENCKLHSTGYIMSSDQERPATAEIEFVIDIQ